MQIGSKMAGIFPDLNDNQGRLIRCLHNLGYNGWHRAGCCSKCSANVFGSGLPN